MPREDASIGTRGRSTEIPNETTREAMEEAGRLLEDPRTRYFDSVEELRRSLEDLVDAVQDGTRAVIESDAGSAVLLSRREFDGMMETIELLSFPGMAEDLDEARTMPLSEMEPWDLEE